MPKDKGVKIICYINNKPTENEEKHNSENCLWEKYNQGCFDHFVIESICSQNFKSVKLFAWILQNESFDLLCDKSTISKWIFLEVYICHDKCHVLYEK